MKDSSCHQSSTEEEEDEHIPPNNVYFDKQLTHLVLSEEFDFSAISHILSTRVATQPKFFASSIWIPQSLRAASDGPTSTRFATKRSKSTKE